MEEEERFAARLSLRAAACMLAGDARDPAAGGRVRRAVDRSCAGPASRRRTPTTCEPRSCWPCSAQPAAELRCRSSSCAPAPPPSRATRRSTTVAGALARRSPRRQLPEPAAEGARPGSLADGLDEVAAAAHRRRVRADLVLALDRLDAPQRAAIGAHAEGGAARAAGLPRSTYYRVLAHAQARLRSDLRDRLDGVGALGGALQRAREMLQHVEAAHGAAAAATAAVAITAAVVLGVHDEHATPLPAPVPVVAAASLRRAGGRRAAGGREGGARGARASAARDRRCAATGRRPRAGRRGRVDFRFQLVHL